MNRQGDAPAAQWRPRRKLAWTIRLATVVVPFVAAVAVMIGVARVVHRPTSGLAETGWYVALLGLSWLTARLVGRLMDRSLPLAALLEMSLTFPESAPSRLGMAQRTSSRAALAKLAVSPPDETPQDAAERILRLMTALSAHDRFTRGHAERVRAYADLLAEKLEMSKPERDRLGWASLLHDIGKLEVPSTLLMKPGKPTGAEWDILKQHPAAGAVIAAPLLAWLSPMDRVIEQHHERWDGTGYPLGLAAEDISFGARVVSVVDCFEAMTATRPYSRPMKRDAALREVVRCAGSHFDPAVVRALLAVPERRLAWVMGPAAWLASLPVLGQAPLAAVRAAAAHGGTFTVGATAAVVVAVTPGSVIGPPSVADAAPAVDAPVATPTSAQLIRTAAPAPTPTRHSGTATRALPSPTDARPTTHPSPAPPTRPPGPAATPSPAPTPTTPTAATRSAPSPGPKQPAKPTIAKPGATTKPVKTAKPATPKPVKTPKPTKTPQPATTPKPATTPTPAKPPHVRNAIVAAPTPSQGSGSPGKQSKPPKPPHQG